MKNKSDFWTGLDSMPSGAALLADWQLSFGPDFPLLEPFLKVTTRQAESYPCPEHPPCECRHVIRETESGLIAICTCEPGECDPVPIEPKDLMVYALDRRELGSAICRSLGFTPLDDTAVAPYSTPGIQEIGSHGPLVSPVYLAFAPNGSLLRELEKLFTTRPAPFVLLTPTPTGCTAETISALERHACAHISLSAALPHPLSPTSPTNPPNQVRQLLAPFTKHLTGHRDS